MFTEETTDVASVSPRRKDAFDIFHFKHYAGPNLDLATAAVTFDFALSGYREPLPLADYVAAIAQHYPHLQADYDSYAQLFACTVAEVAKLDMDLEIDRWSLKDGDGYTHISVESLHGRTGRAVVYCVWDWFEAITQDYSFALEDQIEVIQGIFRQSVYGGPTVYALLRTAREKGIPTFYLWDEGLMQYGYGKHQVRGIATTFDRDSHIDSDFTTRKDDCKAFLETLGFPVPRGEIVVSRTEALSTARRIGYPVAVKPVVGHKGIGVTADVQDALELEAAFDRAVRAIPEDQSVRVIVETSISGADFRLLCVNGRFVAATERRPASVIGDGRSTIRELIYRENRTAARVDTPTSPLGKIKMDDAMEVYLEAQELSLDSVLERDREIYLRKVANLSAGGTSIDATRIVHPDNIILAQDIAQHFHLTCLGIDAITPDLGQSWKEGNFGILEINSAPGIFMHLKPAVGESVDVTSHILETFFALGADARIPTLTCNRLSTAELKELIDHILLQHPTWTIGAACREGVFVNRSQKVAHADYNLNIQNLLRNPRLDLLIAEYNEAALEAQGLFYDRSSLVVLDNPTETEMMLTRDIADGATVVIREGNTVSIRRGGLIEQYQLGDDEPFIRVYLKEVATIL